MKVKIAIVNSTSFGIKFPEHIEKLKEFADVERINFPRDVNILAYFVYIVNKL